MTPTRVPHILLSVALVACAPKAEVADTGRDANADTDVDTDTDTGATTAVLATVSEDYSVGVLATATLDGRSVTDEIVDISGDPVVVSTGGYIFQLNRLGFDNVRVYEPGDWSAPRIEFALADNANPHDVQVCAGKAFVTQYGLDQIAVYDPTTGILTGTVDMAPYSDRDGKPEASHIVQAPNNRLYISYENLDRDNGWTSVGGGVVEVDCEGLAVTNQWDFASPWIFPHAPDPSKVVVYEQNVGLHILDTATGTPTLVLDTADIGGTVVGYAAHGTGAVIGLSDPSYNYGIGCIDTSDWSYSLAEMVDNYLPTVTGNDRGEAWISARSHWSNPAAANGAIVYDIEQCRALTNTPVSTVLAPSSIAFY